MSTNEQKKKTDKMETFGGYMAVDRVEALKHNWKQIKKLTLPSKIKKSS